MYIVSVKVSIMVMKHRGQTRLESQSIKGNWGKNSKWAGTWRQELMQEPWKCAPCWLVPHDLLSLFSYRTQNYQPGDATTHNEMGPPTSI